VAQFFPHKSDEEAVEFVAEKEAAFRALAVSSLGPIAGLASLVSAADDRGLRRAAVTNAPRANASQLIAAAGVGEWIGSNLIVGDELPEAKPSPLPYLRACELLDVNPAQAIVCEDSRSGIAAAVAAGICCVGITTSLDAEELLRLGCAAAVDDYAQLLQLLGWKAE
jgi:HAD superfamily hydrolase (TIGR01509 family)